MPEIQAYTTGSKTSDLFEVTITQSGTKFYLDTNADNVSLNSLRFLGANQLITDNIEQRELFNQMVEELKLIRKQLEFITDEKISLTEVI